MRNPKLGAGCVSSDRPQPHLDHQRPRRAIAQHPPQVRRTGAQHNPRDLLTSLQAQQQPCSPHSAGWVRPSTPRCPTTPSRSTPSARSTDSWPPASAPPCGSSYVEKPALGALALTKPVDVPREEGRPGPARLEAPLGPLNVELRVGGCRRKGLLPERLSRSGKTAVHMWVKVEEHDAQYPKKSN